jgi:uncharacterized membrane protein YccC
VSQAKASTGGSIFAPLLAVLARIDVFNPRGRYVMRSILAASLALAVAFLLQLETPYSAASTVLLVINPAQGAVIGKGTWRILGTLMGMLVALLLMAAFGQMPWLFILGFALWLGLCVAGMTLLRHFRASGTVVAGYTIGLATYGAMQHPELTFEHVIGRGSTVVIGVVCLGLVSALFSRRGMRARLQAHYGRLSVAVAKLLARQHASLSREAPDAERIALLSEIYSLDDSLALGKAESAEIAHQAATIRHGMSALFAALVGGAPHGTQVSPERVAPLLRLLEAAWHVAIRELGEGGEGVERAVTVLQQARQQLHAQLAQLTLTDAGASASVLIAGDRLLEQMDDYVAALQGLLALQLRRSVRHHRARPAVHFHRDWSAALENGVRSAVAIILAGAFWIYTGWDQGDMMLLVVAPYCALLATAGNPAAGAWAFLKGTVLAVPAAFVCCFGLFPYIDGFALLVVVLAIFWLPGIYATSVPSVGLAGLAYLVAFNTLAAASNPMHFDLELFLNQSLAWVLATAFTLFAFQLVLPRNLRRDLARLRRRIRDEALLAMRKAGAVTRGWEQRQQHRIAQLAVALKADPEVMLGAITEGMAALHVGRELVRIRRRLLDPRLAAPLKACARNGLRRLSRRVRWPSLAARQARGAAQEILLLARESGQLNHESLALHAAFIDVARLLEAHRDYFTLKKEDTNAQ